MRGGRRLVVAPGAIVIVFLDKDCDYDCDYDYDNDNDNENDNENNDGNGAGRISRPSLEGEGSLAAFPAPGPDSD